MPLLPRLTIRCALEDLQLHHWNSDGPLSGFLDTVDHEVVAKAIELFPESRDNSHAPAKISKVKPTCYKIKINRHRAAAYVDQEGQVWIVAAGRREGKSRKDFYQVFMLMDASTWLPTETDLRLLEKHKSRNRLIAWEKELWDDITTNMTEQSWINGFTMEIRNPFDAVSPPICTLFIGAVSIDDEPLGIEVKIRDIKNAQYTPLCRLSHKVALSWVHHQEQQWSITYNNASIMFDDKCRASDVFAGKYRAEGPLLFSPGAVAHRVRHKSSGDICTATIEGTPVQALCGQTFVPRQDHESLEKCADCENILEIILKGRE